MITFTGACARSSASRTTRWGDHWSLRPDGPYRASINVLVNGTAEVPAIWVFDPHVKNDGVLRSVIKNEDELMEIVKQIKDRLDRAARQGSPPLELP